MTNSKSDKEAIYSELNKLMDKFGIEIRDEKGRQKSFLEVFNEIEQGIKNGR